MMEEQLNDAQAQRAALAGYQREVSPEVRAIERRLDSIRSAASETGASVFVVRDTSNIRWVTGLDGVFDAERAHVLVVTPSSAYLHTDSRYSNAIRTGLARVGSAICVSEERLAHMEFARRMLDAEGWPAPSATGKADCRDSGGSGVDRNARGAADQDETAADASVFQQLVETAADANALAQLGEAAADVAALAQLGEAAADVAAGAQAGRAPVVGFEDTIAYAEYLKAVESFGAASLVATTDAIVGLRAVKGPGELKRLRAAQAITDDAFDHIVAFMRPGMTEREVQLELEDYMLRHGAEALAFSSIVATGPNGADPHAIPGPTRLEAGQCVVIDFGARAGGYCSDMTRTVFVGQPDAQLAHAWQVLRQANEAVEEALRPGMTGRDAHELAERVLAEGGFEGRMGHGLGHGVGLDIHEQPVLNLRNDHPLPEGCVVTVEPGIYLPGHFGMRLEDCGVLAADGYRPFSRHGHEMIVI